VQNAGKKVLDKYRWAWYNGILARWRSEAHATAPPNESRAGGGTGSARKGGFFNSQLVDGWQQDLHLSKSSFVRESVDSLSPLQPP